ncbi:MAG: glycosyltransferase family 4 protein [Armatimonadetes bacterium]|nr:glycosyltransferase family 4 protein [Armatimonadota bacterium]
MSLTVLSVAYPFAPVGTGAVGGAEQILTHLDHALVREGHRSLVVACEGSESAGTLIPTPAPPGVITDEVKAEIQHQHRRNVERALERWPVDVIHMHGIDFHEYLPPPGVPALVTLHLPPDWYPDEVYRLDRPDTYLHCVSASQRRRCPPGVDLLPEIENGVPLDDLYARHAKRNFAFTMGRICPEKNFHTALDAGKRVGVPVLLAGEVFPYEWHMQYFREEIEPRLDHQRRFIGPVGLARKRRLLTAARCLLQPSLAPETSSLVAIESLACGTPVIAFPSGALPDIIEHGKTGFIVQSMEEMADAIQAAGEIDPETCREVARERFSLERMVERYFDAYRQIERKGTPPLAEAMSEAEEARPVA